MTAKQPKRRSVRKTPVKASKAKRAPATASPPSSKLDQMVQALRQPKGATITDLISLTGWQMHSVRGAIAGALKKQRGLNVISEKVAEERVYRIGGKA
jgi:hypothetical protein